MFLDKLFCIEYVYGWASWGKVFLIQIRRADFI